MLFCISESVNWFWSVMAAPVATIQELLNQTVFIIPICKLNAFRTDSVPVFINANVHAGAVLP